MLARESLLAARTQTRLRAVAAISGSVHHSDRIAHPNHQRPDHRPGGPANRFWRVGPRGANDRAVCKPREDRPCNVASGQGQVVAGAAAHDGTFLLVGHDSSNLGQGHGGPQNPAVLYTAQDVVADLHGTGLRIERAEPVKRPVQMPDGERVARDAFVRAQRI
jgi:hypothetical protein